MVRYLERMENHRHTGWRHEALHLLYRPASLGRQRKYRLRVPLLHRIHLIPGWLMDAACRRYDSRREAAWYPDFEPIARVEPPIEFTSPPPMPEAELEALQRRAHP